MPNWTSTWCTYSKNLFYNISSIFQTPKHPLPLASSHSSYTLESFGWFLLNRSRYIMNTILQNSQNRIEYKNFLLLPIYPNWIASLGMRKLYDTLEFKLHKEAHLLIIRSLSKHKPPETLVLNYLASPYIIIIASK